MALPTGNRSQSAHQWPGPLGFLSVAPVALQDGGTPPPSPCFPLAEAVPGPHCPLPCCLYSLRASGWAWAAGDPVPSLPCSWVWARAGFWTRKRLECRQECRKLCPLPLAGTAPGCDPSYSVMVGPHPGDSRVVRQEAALNFEELPS